MKRSENSMVAADPRPGLLFVDDEPVTRKWFARLFESEYVVHLAANVEQAVECLQRFGPELALLVTDFRMPGRDGLQLMRLARREHRHLVSLLVTAFVDKDLAVSALNQGQAFRIIEKPMDLNETRLLLREAVVHQRALALARAVQDGRLQAMRETLGFLAHELNTPLATVAGLVQGIRQRHRLRDAEQAEDQHIATMEVVFAEHRPGEVLAALDSMERSALYCQSMVAALVRSALQMRPEAQASISMAGSLVRALLDEYPFSEHERALISVQQQGDFVLPGARDLIFLVLSTVIQNALQALRYQAQPKLQLVIRAATPEQAGTAGTIDVADNGPGVPEAIRGRLLREPVTGRAHEGGNGMGLLFCRRVMQSLQGSIELISRPAQGTTVSLQFPSRSTLPDEVFS